MSLVSTISTSPAERIRKFVAAVRNLNDRITAAAEGSNPAIANCWNDAVANAIHTERKHRAKLKTPTPNLLGIEDAGRFLAVRSAVWPIKVDEIASALVYKHLCEAQASAVRHALEKSGRWPVLISADVDLVFSYWSANGEAAVR